MLMVVLMERAGKYIKFGKGKVIIMQDKSYFQS